MMEEQDWTIVKEFKTPQDWVQLRRYPNPDRWCVVWGDKSRWGGMWRFVEYPCGTESEAWRKYEKEVAEARKWA